MFLQINPNALAFKSDHFRISPMNRRVAATDSLTGIPLPLWCASTAKMASPITRLAINTYKNDSNPVFNQHDMSSHTFWKVSKNNSSLLFRIEFCFRLCIFIVFRGESHQKSLALLVEGNSTSFIRLTSLIRCIV